MSGLMVFLPPDNDSMTNGTVISRINSQLEKFIKSSPEEFKIVLRQDSSILKTLDSYLQYRQRPFDKAVDIQPSREEDDLAKQIFLLLMTLTISSSTVHSK